MGRRLTITVDVEAQPRRAATEPLERLIWGRFPGAGDFGIARMMDIADSHGVPLTMFLDYCEVGLYGDAILDVARDIDRRGHDVQLHAHLDFMPEAFWPAGMAREYLLDSVSPELAGAMFDFLIEAHEKALGKKPVAFRGGGYRFNRAVLDAMVARGVMLDSSVNVSRKTQPAKLPNRPQFRWDNGCIELPISNLAAFGASKPLDFNYSSGRLSTPERMMHYLEAFWREQGEDAVAVLVLHSWGLLTFDKASGFFTGPNEAHTVRFDAFLKLAVERCEIVSCATLARDMAQGTLPGGTLARDALDVERIAPDGMVEAPLGVANRLRRWADRLWRLR